MTARLPVLAAALAALLALAGSAAADREHVHLTTAGNAAARAVVLQRADLGTASGWTGGARKPDLSQTLPCTGYRPKQSDLTLVGAARSTWTHSGLQLDSEAQVLATAAMVRLDWQRTVAAPQMLPCLRSGIAKGLSASQTLVSLQTTAFPRIGPYTRAYRAVIDVATATGTVRVMADLVAFGRGRTEVLLTATAALADSAVVRPAEIRLARLLASRIRA